MTQAPNVFSVELQAGKEIRDQLNYVDRTDGPILDRTSFMKEWNTNAYLEDFYTKVEDPAMKMVLTFLPNIVARVGPVQRVCDFGAGPTIHVAVCFRNTAQEIYLADYLPQNCEWLENWVAGKSTFDWSLPLKMIATQEGSDVTGMQSFAHKKEVGAAMRELIANMERDGRHQVKGVFHCDCFKSPSVDCPANLQGLFDVITTIFCVEYCCNTHEEYQLAIKNIVDEIRPGGYFIMGGILEETWCSFGGRKFTCLFITRDSMLDALRAAGLLVDDAKACVYYEINGMFMICAKKA